MNRSSLVLLVAAVLFMPHIAHATTWNVPLDAPTIQAGIDSASAGDTVLVACGTYYEHDIVMKSGVCLRSASGMPDCAIIDGQELGRIFLCEGTEAGTTIEGFTVERGFAAELYPQSLGYGGGLRCLNSMVAVANCVFCLSTEPRGTHRRSHLQ